MNTRRYDLDWLRIMVFALLIFYHVGMFFVPWEWHIKNNDISETLRVPMLFVNQWRLPILFVISGMGTRYALSGRGWKSFIRERSSRLLIPLIAGMVLVVPPQVYIERLVSDGYSGNFWQFYVGDYFTRGSYPTGNFSWHHLWFLPYLLLFSLLLSPVFVYFRDNPANKFIRAAKKIWLSPYGIWAYLLPPVIVLFTLEPYFPVTHALLGDYYTLTFYFILFFYGFLFIAFGEDFWNRIEKLRKKALVLGIVAFIFFIYIIFQPYGPVRNTLYVFVKSVNLGCWLIVLFAYAARYLNKPGNNIAYWNQAVYPFYIFHQTVTIVLAYYIHDTDYSMLFKAIFLSVFTFVISWGLFELARRFRISRSLFGIKQGKTGNKRMALRLKSIGR